MMRPREYYGDRFHSQCFQSKRKPATLYCMLLAARLVGFVGLGQLLSCWKPLRLVDTVSCDPDSHMQQLGLLAMSDYLT